MSDKMHLELNPDIEQMPTPKIPTEREVVSRIKVNAISLKALCRDIASFISHAKDQTTPEATLSYFTRMYHLLLRLSNDIAGHEYDAAHSRMPISPHETDEALLENLRDSFHLIDEALQDVYKPSLNPEIISLLDEIIDLEQTIKREIIYKPKKRPTSAEARP